MVQALVSVKHQEKYQHVYERGYDKKYPSVDLTRLERWYFKGQPGRVLDYGFGVGENLLHLLECGYRVDGIEVSPEAKRIVERKLAQRPALCDRATLQLLSMEASRLPYAEESFDYVICFSVLSLLESRTRVEQLLQEFRRVMKSGAKMLVDINGPPSDFAKHGVLLGNDVYEYRGNAGEEEPRLYYCPGTAAQFQKLLHPFIVDDIGVVSFRYLGNEDFEFLACVRKP